MLFVVTPYSVYYQYHISKIVERKEGRDLLLSTHRPIPTGSFWPESHSARISGIKYIIVCPD